MLNIKNNLLKCTKFNLKRTYIRRVKKSNNQRNIIVEFEDNAGVFPWVWLRDNCTCSQCFHKDSQSRIINWNEFDVTVSPITLQVNEQDKVEIKWSDNHMSIFTEDWLRERSFDVTKQDKYLKENYKPNRIYWDGKREFEQSLKTYKYQDVIKRDEKLYNFLKDLAVYGVVILKETPPDPKENLNLARTIGFVRETHYGKEFAVTSKPGTSNVAYLSNFLQLHTDLPYYHYKPGTNFLHCVVQTESEGGENLLSDSFFVAEKLRNEMKHHFDILSSVEVNWSDYGVEDGVKFSTIHRAPVISLDSNSEISCVRHSIPQRDSFFTVPLEKVTPWYHALSSFVKLLNEHSLKLKLNEGDILAFDNTRITHGRLQYKDSSRNQRYLVGIYMDWDEIYSKIRTLKKDLNLSG